MTFKRSKTLLPLLAVWGLLLGPAAWAQVDTTRAQLPDIAPREIEIRGQLEISFPSLQRQPLIGFNPPPRVPQPPQGRRPFVETFKQASADLPSSPLRRPQPPSALTGAAYPPAQGRIEGVAGRYYSRAVLADITAPFSENTTFLTRLNYRGADGHEPFESTLDSLNIRDAFDALEGEVGVFTSGSRWAAALLVDGFYETYDLYGAEAGVTTFPLLLRPERQGSGGHAAARVRTVAPTPVSLDAGLRFGSARYETRFSDDANATDGVLDLSEQRFAADADVSAPLSQGEVWADGSLSTATLGDDRGTVTAAEGGAGLRLRVGNTVSLSVGGRFLGAFSDTVPGADNVRVGYASPDVRVEVYPSVGVRLFAQNRPTVEANSLSDVFRANPYLIAQPELRPTLRSIDAEAGGNVFVGPVQIALSGGYQEMPQFLFFEQEGAAEAAGYSRGFSALRYAEAEVYHAGGSVSVVLPGGLHALLGARYRDGRFQQGGADIPYFAPIVGEATVSYSFDASRGLVQLTGHYESPRYRDRAQTREVGAYVDVDAEASYNVTRLLGLLLRVENIGGSDNERWDHYAVSPLVIGVGVRVQW